MGLSASQARLLLLTAKQSDLELRAQQISQRRLVLSSKLQDVTNEYQSATSNKQMKLTLVASDEEARSTTTPSIQNLNYSTLVATTKTFDSSLTGLNQEETPEFATSNCYRLADFNGNIVVSNEDEIPEAGDNQTKVTNKDGSITITTKNDDGTETSDTYVVDPNLATSTSSPNYIQECIRNGKYVIQQGIKSTQKQDITQDITGVGKCSQYTYTVEENGKSVQKIAYKLTSGGDDNYYDADGNKLGQIKNMVQVIKPSATIKTGDNVLINGKTYTACTYKNNNELITIYKSGGNYYSANNLDVKKSSQTVTTGLKWTDAAYNSISVLSDDYYTDDDAEAQAKYDNEQNEIQTQDKALELELNEIEAQRTAISTEIESVGKVIDNNIEKSFNIFS